MNEQIPQSGYLHQKFRLFHLKDKKNQDFEFHYHEFNKIIIFLSGSVTYLVEGKSYQLKPWDVLLVNNHDMHKPIIDPGTAYERIVIWLQDDFIKSLPDGSCDLSACFEAANDRRFNLIRLSIGLKGQLQTILSSLEDSFHSDEFGSGVLQDTYFLQLMVYLNRVFLNTPSDTSGLCYDKQIEAILAYINMNLTADLSNEALAEKFFLSKYYLMHKFKEETGYTLHRYVQQKRLLFASGLIREGVPITKAAAMCGFQDYSTFLRAFRKLFHHSPRELADHGTKDGK